MKNIKVRVCITALVLSLVTVLLCLNSDIFIGNAVADTGHNIELVCYGAPPLVVDGYAIVQANGMSTTKVRAYVTNDGGHPKIGETVYLKDASGQVFEVVTLDTGFTPVLRVGPHTSSYNETITASVSPDFSEPIATYKIRFVGGNLAVWANSPSIKAGDPIIINASFKDGSTPMVNVPILLTILKSDNTLSQLTINTDSNGQIGTIYNCPDKIGINIITAQISKLSLMSSTLVYTISDAADNISINLYPSDSVLANGKENHMILAQVVDKLGNGIGGGVPVTIANEYGDSVVVFTSSHGWVNAVSMPSIYPGTVNYTASTINNITVPFTLYYTTGCPSTMTLNAYPRNIASGEVINENIKYDIHTSQIVAYVADNFSHPLQGQPVILSLTDNNGTFKTPDGNYVNTITGYTDINGQFIAPLNVSGTAYYQGVLTINAVNDNATWGTHLESQTSVTYTNQSHLNVSTSVDRHTVEVNDTFNVTVKVDGVGWQEGRQPIDLMLVVDKSGSMGDAMNNIGGHFEYNPSEGGWFNSVDFTGNQNIVPTNNTYVKIGSFQHTRSTRMIVNMDQVNPVPTPIPTPRANFTGAPLTIFTGDQVTFTDKSTGFPDTWSWNFGDGNTSSAQNPPAKTYYTTTPGQKFTVTLTVTNGAGTDTKTLTDYITVNMRAPVANFAATPTTGIWPLNVSFTSSSTGDAPLTYQWSFGDGTANSTAKNPYHVYAAPGTYTVILTVTNPVGSSSMSRSGLVQVSNPGAPVVAYTANKTSGYKPMAVQFTSTSTGMGSLTYNWTFGDGNTSTLQSPVNIYGSVGTYTVSLRVTSNYSGYVTETTLTKSNWITVQNPTVPTANFSANPVYGEWPLTVTFTDLSTGVPAPTYLWNFGDGTTSTDKNPVHTYNSAKVVYGGPHSYTVTLTVTNLAGSDSMVKTNHITVIDPVPPAADFVGTPTTGMRPLTVTFTDLSTGSPQTGKTTMDYLWNFGDGTSTSTVRNVTHTYSNAGTYTVSLTATNARGSNKNTKIGYIIVTAPTPTPTPGPTVTPTPTPTPTPVANFYGVPTSGVKSLTVQFYDQSTNTPTSWSWNFGDGVTSTSRNPVHVYNNVGTYSVTLTATNGGGSSAPYTRTDYITVTDPIPPHADFTADNTVGIRPFTINFVDKSTGSGTFTYLWDFGDGTTSTVRNASHTYTVTGTYTVSLTINSITYPGNSDQLVRSNYITIKDPNPPEADFTYTQPRNYWPVTVTFTDQTGGTPPFTYDWDFGDGATLHANSGQTVVTHTYNRAGTFSVSLTSHNEMGDDTETKSNIITVYDPVLPTASFYADKTSGPYTLRVNFIASASTGTPPLTYKWNFGEGAIVTTSLPTISHNYANVGTYDVTLTVSNEWGSDVMTKDDYIVVNYPPPVANFNPASASGKVPYTVSFTDTSSNPTSWLWDFGDGTIDLSRNPTHTYTTPGRYTVSLTVANPSGSNTKTVPDMVTVAPVAAFEGTPTSGSRPLNVQFTDDSDGSPTTWLWNFGDGVTSSAANPSHKYNSSGLFTVSLTVTANGVSDTLTKTNYITVNSVIPHGVVPSDDSYAFHIIGPNGTMPGGDNIHNGSQLILFGNLASTDDGSLTGTTAATPGTYDFYAKRTYTQGPMYGYDIEVYDNMKLGQSVDIDSAAKVGARDLLSRLWISDRAGLVTYSDEGTVDAPLAYLNGTPKHNLIEKINTTNSFGWTDMYGGMYNARMQFESHPNPRPDVSRIEVLLTDGKAISSMLTADEEKALCQQEADLAVASDIKIYTIGIADSEANIDRDLLVDIAQRTGGVYQFASTPEDIVNAFKNIGYLLDQNITTGNSYLHLVPERTLTNGTWSNNTTIIAGTSYTWPDDNMTAKQNNEPSISHAGNLYTHTWQVDAIKLSHSWTLTYQAKANKVGYTYPICNVSYASFAYNSSPDDPKSVPVMSDLVYVSANLTDNMTDQDMLSIHISMPYEGYPITQPSQDLLWLVNYHGIAQYSVVKEYAPYGTQDWKPIGGVDISNRTKTFTGIWNLGQHQVMPGKYTFRIRATDGWFNATATVNVSVQFMPGQINVVDSP